MITNERVIEILEGEYKSASMFLTSAECKEHNEAINKAIEAVRIQIPTRPKVTLPNFKMLIPFSIDCPTCGTLLTQRVKRCCECGQLIDWSDYDFSE